MFTAATKTSVAHLEFINALAPIVLAPLGFLFFRERPQWKALRWGVFSFAGIAIVLSFGPANGVATVEGDLLVATAFCAFLSYLLLTKRARAADIEQDALDELLDAESPKDALIALLVEAELGAGANTAAAEAELRQELDGLKMAALVKRARAAPASVRMSWTRFRTRSRRRTT